MVAVMLPPRGTPLFNERYRKAFWYVICQSARHSYVIMSCSSKKSHLPRTGWRVAERSLGQKRPRKNRGPSRGGYLGDQAGGGASAALQRVLGLRDRNREARRCEWQCGRSPSAGDR